MFVTSVSVLCFAPTHARTAILVSPFHSTNTQLLSCLCCSGKFQHNLNPALINLIVTFRLMVVRVNQHLFIIKRMTPPTSLNSTLILQHGILLTYWKESLFWAVRGYVLLALGYRKTWLPLCVQANLYETKPQGAI